MDRCHILTRGSLAHGYYNPQVSKISDERAKDPDEEKERDAHTLLQKTGMRITTLKPSGLASYTTC